MRFRCKKHPTDAESSGVRSQVFCAILAMLIVLFFVNGVRKEIPNVERFRCVITLHLGILSYLRPFWVRAITLASGPSRCACARLQCLQST